MYRVYNNYNVFTVCRQFFNIQYRRYLCALAHGKLCFGAPETFRATQNLLATYVEKLPPKLVILG
jgi:hypothetical protein